MGPWWFSFLGGQKTTPLLLGIGAGVKQGSVIGQKNRIGLGRGFGYWELFVKFSETGRRFTSPLLKAGRYRKRKCKRRRWSEKWALCRGNAVRRSSRASRGE